MGKKIEKIRESTLIKVPSNQLRLGMYVSKLDRPWLETTFTYQGFLLEQPQQIDVIRGLCEFVYVDVLKTRYQFAEVLAESNDPVENKVDYRVTEDVENEFFPAVTGYRNALNEVVALLKRVGKGENGSARVIKQHVGTCVKSLLRNPSALLWLTRIKHADQYTAEHCVNVGILAMAFGRHLGLERRQIELLGLCGMLHDVGKMRTDQKILNKAGKLTPEEFEHIKQHPVLGRDLLLREPFLAREVVEAAYGHHERMDAGGYPRRLPAGNLSFYTRVISVVDAYDAMTSERCYDRARPPALALKLLYLGKGKQFDSDIVVKFIECIGIYPPGSLVEMTSGEVGVVLSADPKKKLLPKVALVLDKDKRPMPQKVVNLQVPSRDIAGKRYGIQSVLTDGSYGIDLEAYTRENIHLPAAASTG